MVEFVRSPQGFRTARITELTVALLVCFGLLTAIAMPPLSIAGLGVYLITVVSPVVLVLVSMFWLKKPITPQAAWFPFALGSMVCVASLLSWTAGYSSINYRDIFESVKYFQFFPYLLALSLLTSRSLRVIQTILVCSAIWVGFVGLLQVSGLSYGLSRLYLGSDSVHIDSVISGSRITLTGSDPNIGAVIACFFCIYFFSLFSVTDRFKHFFAFCFFFFLCFMTQSRTALVAVLFGLGVYYILFFRSFFLVRWFFVFCFISLVVFFVFYLDLSYIYLGIKHALEGKNNSLNVRFENVVLATQRFGESPVFGMGPAKSSFSTIIDSEYALIVQRYGIIGIVLFFSYLVYLIRLAYRNLDSHWGISLFSFVLMSILVMITNNIFSGYQLMSLVVLLNIACVLNERAKEDLNKESTV